MRKPMTALLTAVCLVVAACGSGAAQNDATSTPAAPPPTPVAVGALKGLLLSPDQIGTALGATKMTLGTERTFMYDNSATVSDADCRAVQEPAQISTYPDSQWIALQGNMIQECAAWTHLVDQAVVLFVSAKHADAFFTAATKRWQARADGRYDITRPGKPAQTWTVGPVGTADGTLTATLTSASPTGGGCQRALTVANNVAIDTDVCSADPGDAAAPPARAEPCSCPA